MEYGRDIERLLWIVATGFLDLISVSMVLGITRKSFLLATNPYPILITRYFKCSLLIEDFKMTYLRSHLKDIVYGSGYISFKFASWTFVFFNKYIFNGAISCYRIKCNDFNRWRQTIQVSQLDSNNQLIRMITWPIAWLVEFLLCGNSITLRPYYF